LEESGRDLFGTLSLIFLMTLRRKPKSLSRRKDSKPDTSPTSNFEPSRRPQYARKGYQIPVTKHERVNLLSAM